MVCQFVGMKSNFAWSYKYVLPIIYIYIYYISLIRDRYSFFPELILHVFVLYRSEHISREHDT